MLAKEKLEEFFGWLLTNEKLPYLNPKFEEIIENIYLQILGPGDTSIDVGSHIGVHTIPMAKRVGPQGRVFSFEPIPRAFKKQKKKLRKLSLKNVILENCAISNVVAKSTFRIIKNSPGLSGLRPAPHQGNGKVKIIKTAVRTIDSVIKDKTSITFIKVDTEGGDFHVLQGALQVLKESRPVITFECGAYQKQLAKSYDYSKEDFIAFFKEVEYNLYSIIGLEYNPGLWGTRIPPYLVGIPFEKKDEILEVFRLSILKALTHHTSQNDTKINEETIKQLKVLGYL